MAPSPSKSAADGELETLSASDHRDNAPAQPASHIHPAIALAGSSHAEVTDALDRIVHRTMAMDFAWDWPGGVAFYGIARAWSVTREDRYLAMLRTWFDEHIEAGLPKLTVNAISLGHTLLDLYAATDEERYLEIALEMAKFLDQDATRFADGILQHTVSQNYSFPEQAWADTLFMAALFLLKLGARYDHPQYVADALRQYAGHEEFLQDETTNLYYHAWDNLAGDNLSGVHWARANAWAALTAAEALREIDVTNPAFMRIADSLRDQLSALVRLQTANGLWTTVLDDEGSYEEVSASAGIGNALIVQGRILSHHIHDHAIARTLRGILANIDADGRVRNVSAGTAVMPDRQTYGEVPRKRIQGWGQGLTLAFLAALLEES